MKKVAFYTLGCKVNQYETEAMREMFENNGYSVVDFEGGADIYVINTCSVTQVADRKSRRIINRAANLSPEATIVVTGCYSQVSSEEVSKLKNVDIVIGNDEKSRIIEIVEKAAGEKLAEVGDIMQVAEFRPMFASANGDKTRALIKIEEGCNNFCSYCIIPYARGPVRSRSEEDIIKEATTLARAGYKEIVLTGIHITSYGTDRGGAELADLLIRLHEVEGIERIRLGSLELTPEMKRIAQRAKQLPKLCPHFHISLQSGSDTVLKRMNRRYTSQEYYEAAQKLKDAFPGAALTTDIMVGFPGETDREFEESLEFAKKVGFAKAHVFPYSPRKGTVAAKMANQVSEEIKKVRAEKMQMAADELEKDFCNNIVGSIQDVLFEREVLKGTYEGHAGNYMVVRVKSDANISGKIVKIIITGVTGKSLVGKIAQ
ncbi:MAG: tRNA (N(6)-L-threonylcarbamoyladenosine(37)-C(2))-methylthiotransferase MtaB [Clostridia bacterium]|nr:tRNA (N(6)-L-threonylcarbamoyladenosine(37)-C(2))-methylthiotransferase MtaB [Clostridia bacterium]